MLKLSHPVASKEKDRRIEPPKKTIAKKAPDYANGGSTQVVLLFLICCLHCYLHPFSAAPVFTEEMEDTETDEIVSQKDNQLERPPRRPWWIWTQTKRIA